MDHVTIYDIAREAGVSVSTVSRVLNGTAPVKITTKRKVMELIGKYKFQPNALARSLVKKRTGMVGMILPDIGNACIPEFFSGAEEAARELGYTLIICNTQGHPQRESEYLKVLSEKKVDGILFMGGRINAIGYEDKLKREMAEVSKCIPIVFINGSLSNQPCHSIMTDEFAGIMKVMLHLIQMGHSEIGLAEEVDCHLLRQRLHSSWRNEVASRKGIPYS